MDGLSAGATAHLLVRSMPSAVRGSVSRQSVPAAVRLGDLQP
jgi:hypothetical protein